MVQISIKKMANRQADVYIIDKLDRQTITFSDKVLFDSGQSDIKAAGYEILNVVGPIIAKNLTTLAKYKFKAMQILALKTIQFTACCKPGYCSI